MVITAAQPRLMHGALGVGRNEHRRRSSDEVIEARGKRLARVRDSTRFAGSGNRREPELVCAIALDSFETAGRIRCLVPPIREPGTDDEKPLYVDISAMLDGTTRNRRNRFCLGRSDGRDSLVTNVLCRPSQPVVPVITESGGSAKTWVCLACAVEGTRQAWSTRVLVSTTWTTTAPQPTVYRLIALGAPTGSPTRPKRSRQLRATASAEDLLELPSGFVADVSGSVASAVAVVDSIRRAAADVPRSEHATPPMNSLGLHSNVLKPYEQPNSR